MKKLLVIDLVVKCVVLIVSALIWLGPAHAVPIPCLNVAF